ncbi:MAG: hypothetical protein AzoDbin1_03060 [Azoarcus sp.]|uniref:Uncharacterized protein n=1 Tax=Aromatoleum tolulyticum TaxID=34027 RepID=A0A1N6QDQ6_9RHOO|nr:hypothetical protein [Azoarcus sp. Aa7]MCK9986588.1 hypothetical protein [Azoarcus sp.]SIQ14744.1 hypothetical protein SAMN05421829_102459 [Aromatoleum tolulyticum]
MRWRFFDLQRIIDEMFVDDWLYPWQPDAVSTGASQ